MDLKRRRRADSRPPHLIFAPTPGALGQPDPDGFERSLAYALEQARKGRRALTLVILEVEGDDEALLAGVAAMVRDTLRDSDGVWRDGPRSLSLLLADTDGASAEPALARIRLGLRGRSQTGVRIGRASAQLGVPADVLIDLARSDLRNTSGR